MLNEEMLVRRAQVDDVLYVHYDYGSQFLLVYGEDEQMRPYPVCLKENDILSIFVPEELRDDNSFDYPESVTYLGPDTDQKKGVFTNSYRIKFNCHPAMAPKLLSSFEGATLVVSVLAEDSFQVTRDTMDLLSDSRARRM